MHVKGQYQGFLWASHVYVLGRGGTNTLPSGRKKDGGSRTVPVWASLCSRHGGNKHLTRWWGKAWFSLCICGLLARGGEQTRWEKG